MKRVDKGIFTIWRHSTTRKTRPVEPIFGRQTAMFRVRFFEPWIGKSYPRLLVLGESRYDEEYTDKKIIESLIRGDRIRTYTNFVQAVVGKRHWEEEYDQVAFWERTIFYNYLTNFFPGRPREAPPWDQRVDPQNQRILKSMLQTYKPTHCIVWGYDNWETIEVEAAEWGPEQPIPGLVDAHKYCSMDVEGNVTLFSYVVHPSTGFSYDRWRAVLSAFLSMK